MIRNFLYHALVLIACISDYVLNTQHTTVVLVIVAVWLVSSSMLLSFVLFPPRVLRDKMAQSSNMVYAILVDGYLRGLHIPLAMKFVFYAGTIATLILSGSYVLCLAMCYVFWAEMEQRKLALFAINKMATDTAGQLILGLYNDRK